ncbi:MAG: thioredoxin family protein [Pseudomonadota bacterium]
MNRRHVLALTTAAVIGLALPASVKASDTVDYTPGLIQNALADGKTVFVDFAADWCSTCARQERVINELRAENPAYDEHILFVRVDWDDFGREEVSTSRNIPRRSTLLVLRGDDELGRIVAGTGTDEIRALLDTALSAATS